MKTKKTLSILLALVMVLCTIPAAVFAASGDIAINEVNFPDANFRAYVKTNFDKDTDGTLSMTEIEKVKEIKVFPQLSDEVAPWDIDARKLKSIASLKGIEYFTSLEYLECSWNILTELDVSKNTKLKFLDCSYNPLITLDVSKNTALEELNCSNREQTWLPPLAESQLTSLNVNGATALKFLDCTNGKLKSLDLSGAPALEILYCADNRLTTINVSKNTKLKRFDCGMFIFGGNQITSLDVSKNTELEFLDCGDNRLTTLDVSRNTKLENLYCDGNQLTTLDVSKNTELEFLICSENQLTALDVSRNTGLGVLYCVGNQIATLDVSRNTALKHLDCGSNQLTTLDVSKNTELEVLICSENQLTSLDISNATEEILYYFINDNLEGLPSFQAENNAYSISVGSGRTFDLTTLPGSFDASRASAWSGGTVSGNILTVNAGATEVTYTYDVGKGLSTSIKLAVTQTVDEPVDTKLPFTDVAADASYYDAVAYLYEAGIMNGTGDTTFSPDFTLNRATVVTMLHRLEGEPEVAADATFTDVEADEWYTAAVYWAASVGIVEGYGDGTFGPRKNVTNEQLAAIIKRYAEYKEVTINETTELPEGAVVSDWAVGNVAWAASEGILSEEQTADAKSYANRAQVAVVFYNYITKFGE